LRDVTILNPSVEIREKAFAGCDALEYVKGLPSSDENIKSYLKGMVFKGCYALKNPIRNEIHLAAEGKLWESNDNFPKGGHLWIQQVLEENNKERLIALEEANSNSDGITEVNIKIQVPLHLL